MAEYVTLTHTFGPLYDEQSRILILGSFPSVKSREANFFYGHPQNRFWKVIARVTGNPVPETIDDKKALLHGSHIALWDTIRQCDIIGSSDSSIRNVIPNDLSEILDHAPVRDLLQRSRQCESLPQISGKNAWPHRHQAPEHQPRKRSVFSRQAGQRMEHHKAGTVRLMRFHFSGNERAYSFT